MILLKESDRPKSLGEKIAEALGRPPMPILRFYGDMTRDGNQLSFAVRNGLPLPLFYGIYVEAAHNSQTEYIEKADHIGPFSVDNWRITLDTTQPSVIKIRVGLIPFEILTDEAQIAV